MISSFCTFLLRDSTSNRRNYVRYGKTHREERETIAKDKKERLYECSREPREL